MKQFKNIDIIKHKLNTNITLFGWVSNIRKMGSKTFVDFRDFSGIVQLVFDKKINFTKESCLKINGIVVKRQNPNLNLATGQYEIIVNDYEILSLSKEIPFEIKDDVMAKEDTRLKFRYLDLRRHKMYENLALRHKIILAIRNWMDKNGFLEIETPILSKSTPEGAKDYLVLTRNPKYFFALPQSPQIYKQLLMISGIEKYFQFSRAFRDEDMRKDRQPEFTQLDIEMSFINEEELFNLIELLFKDIFKQLNINIEIPFTKISYFDALNFYGTDKPDLRYDYLLEDITMEVNSDLFLENEATKLICFDKEISNSQIKILEEIALKNKVNKLYIFKVNDGELTTKNTLTNDNYDLFNSLIKKRNIKKGVLILASDSLNAVNQGLGAIRVKLNELFNLAKNQFNFCWIIDWPMFELDQENNLTPAHHPFTAPSEDTKHFLNLDSSKEDLLKVKARSYDLVLNGFELSSGSIRIHDPNLQKEMFKILKLSDQEIKNKFGFFIDAFNYGAPPHGGIAFGIERLLMIITNSNSIREVIAFPKNANGIDVMLDCPSILDQENINEYGIIYNENKK